MDRRDQMLVRAVLVEWFVVLTDFRNYRFKDRTIQQIFTHHGWIWQLSSVGHAWRVWSLFEGISVTILPDVLAIFLGIEQPQLAYTTMEVGSCSHAYRGVLDFVKVESHSWYLPLSNKEWLIMQLVFVYDIGLRYLIMKCMAHRVSMTLMVTREWLLDLSLYIFWMIQSEVQMTSNSNLHYDLMLIHFLSEVGVPIQLDELKLR